MRPLLSILVLIGFVSRGIALEPAADPTLAVVRITSHGASGTVIQTTVGRSWILSCCHMFFGGNGRIDQQLLAKKIIIDGPTQPFAIRKSAEARVVLIDANADLCLIEIDNGPFHYVPVAPKGFKPGKRISSAGYDLMKWPITHVRNTIIGQFSGWTYTTERPSQGRSGGGLFDLDARVLIGVCNGLEVSGEGRGLFVSHQSILLFLSKSQGAGKTLPLQQRCPT